MAQPSYVPVSMIDSQYMAPHELKFIVATNSTGDHLISDAYHSTVMFKIKPNHTICHNQLVLLDRNDRVIVMLREKIRSVHNRSNAFMGTYKDDSHKKKANIIQSRTNLHVFLANGQRSKDACDFKITGSWSNRNCSILMGDSSKTIAQMQPMQMENRRFYKDKFMITIYPGVDGAFVISLIAIIEAMKDDNHADQVNGDVGSMTQVAGTIVSSIAAVAQVVGTWYKFLVLNTWF